MVKKSTTKSKSTATTQDDPSRVNEALSGTIIPPMHPEDDEPVATKTSGPTHKPSVATRALVTQLTTQLVGQKEIAARLGIAYVTFRKYYLLEVALARASMQQAIGSTILRQALGGPAQYDAEGRLLRAEVPPDNDLLKFLAARVNNLTERAIIELEDAKKDQGFNTAGLGSKEVVERIQALFNRAEARKRIAEEKKPSDTKKPKVA